MTESPVGAASATYRKVANCIAEILDQEPYRSRYPSLDFEAALADIPDALKTKAIEWYIRGIKRGLAKATDLMAEKAIYVEDGNVFAPKIMTIKVRTRVSGGEWEPLKVQISAKEIGFE